MIKLGGGRLGAEVLIISFTQISILDAPTSTLDKRINDSVCVRCAVDNARRATSFFVSMSRDWLSFG